MRIWTVFLLAVAFSGCAAQSFVSVNGKPYHGADPQFAKLKRMGDSGLMPASISCRMPRSGPEAKSPESNTTVLRWVKAPKRTAWNVIVGESAIAKSQRAEARAKGFRRVSVSSFYQSVARQRMSCELWRQP